MEFNKTYCFNNNLLKLRNNVEFKINQIVEDLNEYTISETTKEEHTQIMDTAHEEVVEMLESLLKKYKQK